MSDEKDTRSSGCARSFLRSRVALDGKPTLSAYAEEKARELGIERATDEAAAGGHGIVHVTWQAPPWPSPAGNVLHLVGFLVVGLVYGLVVGYAGLVLHTYHVMPHADVRRAIVRSWLAAAAHAALFFILVLSLAVAILTGAFAAYCWFAGGGHVRDARAPATVALVAAGILAVSYAGILWLSFVKLPRALRGIVRFPFRVASVAAVRQAR